MGSCAGEDLPWSRHHKPTPQACQTPPCVAPHFKWQPARRCESRDELVTGAVQGRSGPSRLHETLVTGAIWQNERDDRSHEVVRKHHLQLWPVLQWPIRPSTTARETWVMESHVLSKRGHGPLLWTVCLPVLQASSKLHGSDASGTRSRYITCTPCLHSLAIKASRGLTRSDQAGCASPFHGQLRRVEAWQPNAPVCRRLEVSHPGPRASAHALHMLSHRSALFSTPGNAHPVRGWGPTEH